MPYLRFVSLFFLLNSCAPAAYKQLQQTRGDVHCIDPFKPDIRRALYQTSVDVAGHHLSGLLLIKQMPDSATRIVFTNEVGYTFFDFEFTKEGNFIVHSILPKMDKEAVKKTLQIEPTPENYDDFSNEVHWVYGTSWGVMRGLLSMVGIRGFAASTVHMAAIWGTAVTLQPMLDIAPPLSEWDKKDIAIDIFHHAVYAIVAGLVYDAMD